MKSLANRTNLYLLGRFSDLYCIVDAKISEWPSMNIS